MASVWLLMKHYPHEYDDVMGVFDDESKAMAEKELILAQPDSEGAYRFAYLEVEEYELQ